MLALTAACVAAVTVATLVRISRTDGVPEGLRAPAATAAVIAPIAIAIFAVAGPLETGWARRAGTPARLLAAHVSAPAATARPVSTRRTLRLPVSATLAGSVSQSPAGGGTIVDLGMNVTGGAHGQLRIRLAGSPLPSGGLSLTGSQVDLLLNGLPSVLTGKVTSLQGQEMVAHVSDGSGTAVDLHVSLNVDSNNGTVTGTMHARAAGGGG